MLYIDKDALPEHAKIAQNFLDRSPSGPKAAIQMGEPLEIMGLLPDEETDSVFTDADKRNCWAYCGESMKFLRNGDLMIADNALWWGRTV